MKIYFYATIFFLLSQTASVTLAQNTKAPAIVWQKTIGGNDSDVLTSLSIGANKSFAVCGYSNSNASGNKSDNAFGGYDFWVAKMDSSGNILWNKTFGGEKNDFAASIINTSDGGYLVGGTSISDSFGSKTSNSNGYSNDYWVLKLDANGNKIWDVTLGGLYTEKLSSLAELPTGYVVGGYSYSDMGGSKKSDNLGAPNNADYWVVILNKNGTISSQNVYGGNGHDILTCVSTAAAGKIYSAGYSYSSKLANHKTKSPVGNNDYWIVRSDLKGKIEYQGNFGGNRSDYLTCMQALNDGSQIFGGYSNSDPSFNKSGKFWGVTDYWLLKLKKEGTKQWDKAIGGKGGDYLKSVQQTKDRGFILGGYSNSDKGNNKTENSKGGNDYWIVKTDSTGKVLWDKTIGGSGDDKLTGIYEIDTNQYIVAGTSGSIASGDKDTGLIGSGGATDFWILRLGPSAQANKISTAQITASAAQSGAALRLDISPNPVKNTLTVKYSAATNGHVGLTIYTVSGKTMLQTTLPATTVVSYHSFNTASLPANVYFVVMYAGPDKITRRFVKE